MNGDMAPIVTHIRLVRSYKISECCWIEPRCTACLPAHFGSFRDPFSFCTGMMLKRSLISLGRCYSRPDEAHMGYYLDHSDYTRVGRGRGSHMQHEGARDSADGLGTQRQRGGSLSRLLAWAEQ